MGIIVQKLPVAYLIVLGVLAAGGFLFLINQLSMFRDRNKRGLSVQTNQEIEQTLWAWLKRQSYALREVQDPNALFALTATEDGVGSPIPINIVRGKEYPQILMLVAILRMAPEATEKLSALSETDYRLLLGDLRIEMARFGIGFGGLDRPLTAIRLQQEVLLSDDLTEFVFLDKMMYMKRAHILVREVTRRAVVEAEAMLAAAKSQPLVPAKEGSQPQSTSS